MITPYHYEYMRIAMSFVREMPSKAIMPEIQGSKYNDIRAMSKKQLRNFIREFKHSGYFHKNVRKWTNEEYLTANKVSYAKSRLKFAFS